MGSIDTDTHPPNPALTGLSRRYGRRHSGGRDLVHGHSVRGVKCNARGVGVRIILAVCRRAGQGGLR